MSSSRQILSVRRTKKNKFQNKQYKPKEFFSYVDKRTKCSNRILSLKHDNNGITNDEDKCEALSQYYSDVFYC